LMPRTATSRLTALPRNGHYARHGACLSQARRMGMPCLPRAARREREPRHCYRRDSARTAVQTGLAW
jgi:hypothetical protein